VRLIVFFAALGFLSGATAALLDCAGRLARQPDAGWFLAGAAVGVLICRPLLRRLPVVETFDHELTHAVAALLLMRGVRRFKVTWRGGGDLSSFRGHSYFQTQSATNFFRSAPFPFVNVCSRSRAQHWTATGLTTCEAGCGLHGRLRVQEFLPHNGVCTLV
jgi:hypothetical protein